MTKCPWCGRKTSDEMVFDGPWHACEVCAENVQRMRERDLRVDDKLVKK